jgi:hypothetical protein
MNIVSRDDLFNRRADRLRAFVDEVRRYIYNQCFNQGVSVVAVDCYCHDMFTCLIRDSSDYSFMELLHMLCSESFLDHAFSGYKSAAIS